MILSGDVGAGAGGGRNKGFDRTEAVLDGLMSWHCRPSGVNYPAGIIAAFRRGAKVMYEDASSPATMGQFRAILLWREARLPAESPGK